jgi:hypothetical protein
VGCTVPEVDFIVCSVIFGTFFEGQKRQCAAVLNLALEGEALVSTNFAETQLN